jgi:hypothetical protein
MAAAGYTPISLYYSTTPTQVPTNTNLVRGELALNITDGKLYYKDDAGVVQVLAQKGGTSTFSAGSTGFTPNTPTGGAVVLGGVLNPTSGGTGISSYATGDLLYASAANTLSKLPVSVNGYVLSLSGGLPVWSAAAASGATITNDTTTATNVYPVFASATSGAFTTAYTSNANYLYKPSTGELQSKALVATNGLVVNSDEITSNYTLGTGFNAVSVGPVNVNAGVVITVSGGQRWVVL